MRWCGSAALLIVVVVAAAACGGADRPKLVVVPGRPGHLIEIDGRHLYFQCSGSGTPTVLLEAGYGGDHDNWGVVEPEIARTTRVCAYDRAGLGLSAAEQPPRRGPFDQLDDLDRILDGGRIEPPYVVVGHSYGGVLAWLFVRRHPDDVAGLLLVDASHPQQVKRFRAALPASLPAAPDEVSPENVPLADALEDAGEVGAIGDTRLVVITAGQVDATDLPPRLVARVKRIWRQLQDDYASRSTDSVHVIARYSPHFIQSYAGQPELVVAAVRELTRAAREGRPLRACRTLFHKPGAECVSG